MLSTSHPSQEIGILGLVTCISLAMSCRSFQMGSRCGNRSFSSCSAVIPRTVTYSSMNKGPYKVGGTGNLRWLGCFGSRSLCNVGCGKPRIASRFSLPSFGYRVGAACGPPPCITPVTVNESLLIPLELDIDPTVQQISTLQKQLDCVAGDRVRLEAELNGLQDVLENSIF